MNDLRKNMLLASYRNAHDLHKFYISFRFTIVGFLLTANGGLYYFWTANNNTCPHPSYVVIAIAGIVLCLSLFLLDIRNRELFNRCRKVAEDIEDLISSTDHRLYHNMKDCSGKAMGSHQSVIWSIAGIGVIFWLWHLIYLCTISNWFA